MEFGIEKDIGTEIAALHLAIDTEGEDAGSSGHQSLPRGWAVRQARSRVTFSDEVKKFLDKKFKEGEETKQKFDPRQTAALMREATKPDGMLLFEPDECLTWQQIASYWSQHARRMREELTMERYTHEDDYTEEPTFSTIDDIIEAVIQDCMQPSTTDAPSDIK